MDLSKSFAKATEEIKSLDYTPSNEDLLKIYGLFKQETEGDVDGNRPEGFNFKAIAKYDSWSRLRGLSKTDAMQQYINLVNSLIGPN